MRPPATTASITIRHSSEARVSPSPRRPYRRRPHRGLAAEVFRSTGLPWPSLLLATALLCLMCPPGGRADEVEVVNCCTGPDAAVDCSSGVEYQGQVRRPWWWSWCACRRVGLSTLRPRPCQVCTYNNCKLCIVPGTSMYQVYAHFVCIGTRTCFSVYHTGEICTWSGPIRWLPCTKNKMTLVSRA